MFQSIKDFTFIIHRNPPRRYLPIATKLVRVADFGSQNYSIVSIGIVYPV